MEKERERVCVCVREKGKCVCVDFLAISIVTSQEGSLEVGKEAKKIVGTQFYWWEREREREKITTLTWGP